MEEEQIKKEMMDLLFEKTKGLFSEKVIDYGTNPWIRFKLLSVSAWLQES